MQREGVISLSTKQLEPEPGDMLKNRELVFDKAEEMAEKYRQKLLAAVQGITLEEVSEEVSEDVVSATDEPVEASTDDKPVAVVEAPDNGTANNEEEPMAAAVEE